MSSSSWRHLPAPARAIAAGVEEAVAAAQAQDAPAFEEAGAGLAGLDPQRVGRVVGGVVRILLEELHPDGLTGDDIRGVLERCVRAAAQWWPPVDANVVVVLLTGALGVHEFDDEAAPVPAAAIARHGALLTADLLAASGRPLAPYLTAVFADIERTETIEQP
jgi:hypothetical protein